jgi:retron-type reverse transcriptase
LEAILYKDNLNRAYKRVKANKGAPGIDGMTIEEALPYLKEHQQELLDRIYRGKYTPSPVRRVEIQKTRRWCAEAWHTNRDRPDIPTGNSPTVSANL